MKILLNQWNTRTKLYCMNIDNGTVANIPITKYYKVNINVLMKFLKLLSLSHFFFFYSNLSGIRVV